MATWISANPFYSFAPNWDPNDIPDSAGETAVFTNNGAETTVLVGPLQVGGFTFEAGAPPYGFFVLDGTEVEFVGAGIINNSDVRHEFLTSLGLGFRFSNSASAGFSRFTIASDGTLWFEDTSSAGTSVIHLNGALEFGDLASAASARVDVNVGVVRLRTSSGSISIGALEGAGTVTSVAGGAPAQELIVGERDDIDTVFWGSITEAPGTVLSLTKVGSGTLWLDVETSTYTGDTIIDAGTLQVDGAIVSPSFINPTATLAGNGDTGAVTLQGGTLAPGAGGAGILTIDDFLGASGSVSIELGGMTAGNGGYDRVHVNGTVELNGAALAVTLINGFNPATGASFVIIDNDGSDAVIGTFSGLGESATFLIGDGRFSISYAGGSGNDVVLTTLNDAPVAQDAALGATEDTVLNGTVTATDVDNSAAQLGYSLVAQAGHGTAVVNADGTFSYTPDPGFTGSDSFTFKASDGSLDSNVATVALTVGAVNDAPVNTVPAAHTVDANTALAIAGLAIDDIDAASGTVVTTLAVAHGTLAVASAGGAAVSGSGTSSVTLTGTLAQINATLTAAGNIRYSPTHDFFGTDTLTVTTNDNGNSGAGGPLVDADQVTIAVGTIIPGSPGDDNIVPPGGNARIDAGLGVDTITFDFRLTDATVRYVGNTVVIDGPGSHTVTGGFETFVFTDGTVNNNDGNALVDDLFYYARNHDVWNVHDDAEAHYDANGWHENRDPSAFFSTLIYLSSNPDVAAAGVNPLAHFHASGWQEGRVPSLAFDLRQYFAANPDIVAAHVDPLEHFLANGAQEGRQPFAATELVAANGFDYVYYLANNPDVVAAGVDPFGHFQNVGWQEGRNPNALFDTDGYLATYADVEAAGVNPLAHYHQSGWREGRDPSVNFDTTSYLAAYADVQASGVDPLVHYLQFGTHEGRSPFADGVWG